MGCANSSHKCIDIGSLIFIGHRLFVVEARIIPHLQQQIFIFFHFDIFLPMFASSSLFSSLFDLPLLPSHFFATSTYHVRGGLETFHHRVTCRHMNRLFDDGHQLLIYVGKFTLELKLSMKKFSFLI